METSAVASQAVSLQSTIALTVLKQVIDSQDQALQLITGGSQANLGSGVGGNIDVSA